MQIVAVAVLKALMGKGGHAAGRGAGVGSERVEVRANERGEQAKMDDGWC